MHFAWIRRGVWIAGGILLGLLLVHRIYEYDTWFHLFAGEHFLDHRSFPETDPWTNIEPAPPILFLHWGSQVLFAAVYRAAGAAGIWGLHALAIAGAFLLAVRADPEGRRGIGAALLFLAAILLAQKRFIVRPSCLTLLLTAAYCWIFGRTAAGRTRVLWGIPLLQVIWANLHGAFPVGIALAAAFAAGTSIEWAIDRRRLRDAERAASRSRALRGAAVAILTAAASCATPFGIRSLTTPTRYVGDLGEVFNEWKPTLAAIETHTDLAIPFWICILVPPLLLPFLRRRPSLGLLFAWGGLAALSFTAIRHVGMFALATAAVAPHLLARVRTPERPFPRPHAVRRLAAALGIVAIAGCGWAGIRIVTGNAYGRPGDPREFGIGWGLEMQPAGAVRFCRERGIERRWFNSYSIGGYLLYNRLPPGKVFLFNRGIRGIETELKEYIRMLMEVDVDPTRWKRMVDRHRFDGVILTHNASPAFTGMIRRLGRDPTWALRYYDHTSAIWTRVRPGDPPLPPVRHVADGGSRYRPFWRGQFLMNVGRTAEGIGDLEEGVRRAPDFASAHVALALARLELDEVASARESAETARRLGREDADFLQLLAVLRLRTGDRTGALAAAREGAEAAPGDADAWNMLGRMRKENGDLEGARKAYRRTLELDSDHAGAREELGRFGAYDRLRRGIRAAEAGEDREAVRLFHEAIEEIPELVEAHLQLGLALRRLRRETEAEGALREAVRLAPADAEVQFQLGALFWTTGRREAAAACWRRALAIDPGHARARGGLLQWERER